MLCAWVIIFTVLGEINYIEAFIFDLWHQYTPWTDSKILSALAWLLNYSGEQTSLEMKNAFGALTFYISIRKEPSANGKCWSKSSYFNLAGCPFCRTKCIFLLCSPSDLDTNVCLELWDLVLESSASRCRTWQISQSHRISKKKPAPT